VAVGRILIVPEALETEIGDSFLNRRSFVVRTARDAAAAMAEALDWVPALIIFGSDMTGMTADEFARAISDTTGLGGVKLLMVADDASASAGHARLSRPINRGELLEKMGDLLGIQVRRARRRTVELDGEMDYKSGNDGSAASVDARILRLSETGVLIECDTRLKLGAVVTVRFNLPEASEPLRSRCIVLFVDEALPRYGVEFVDMTGRERQLIRTYVAAV